MAEGDERESSISQQKDINGDLAFDDLLSSDGKSAYVRLCSIVLCSLYPAQHERPFVKQIICDLVKHLKLSKEAQTALVGQLLCDMDVNLEDFADNSTVCLQSVIKTLKDECGQQQKLVIIPKNLISFALKSGRYDARLRVLVYSIAIKLGISPDSVADKEDECVGGLKIISKDEDESEEEIKRKEEESSRKFHRGLLIGLGAVGGGALIGITGGLAAPFIAAGVGSLFGGGAAVALASIKGVAILTSIFGAAGAGLTGQKLNRRLGSIEQFEFERMTEGDHLNLVVAISGWLKEEQNAFEHAQSGFKEPWQKMKLGREQYCLKWESKYLMELGTAISSFMTSSALSFAAEEAIKHTVLQGLASAVAWPLAVLKIGYVIDNPWGVCASRAAEVGKHLANVLMEKQHGNRPVTLVGFSFGGRVVFHCLKTLSEMKGSEGLIQDAIMIGAPVTGDPNEWQCFEKVVAGRVINAYCRKDWLLKFAYRTASAQVRVAGLGHVSWRNRRMFNVNLSSIVNHHGDYCNKDTMEDILDAVSMGGVCPLDAEPSSDGGDLNGSQEDSGISSLPSGSTEPTTCEQHQAEPDAHSEDVQRAMEQLRQRVDRVLAQEHLEHESAGEGQEMVEQSMSEPSANEHGKTDVTVEGGQGEIKTDDSEEPADEEGSQVHSQLEDAVTECHEEDNSCNDGATKDAVLLDSFEQSQGQGEDVKSAMRKLHEKVARALSHEEDSAEKQDMDEPETSSVRFESKDKKNDNEIPNERSQTTTDDSHTRDERSQTTVDDSHTRDERSQTTVDDSNTKD